MGPFAASVALRTALWCIVGVAVAVATTSFDGAVELAEPIPVSNAHALLPSLVGAVLTIAVFTLWMRTVVVGITAGQLSPRIATSYLDDRFQRRVTGWMAGALAYLVTLTLLLPADVDRDEVPVVSTILAGLVTIAALVAVLMAMRHAVRSLSPPVVVRRLADHAAGRLRQPMWPDDPRPRTSVDEATLARVHARGLGWVAAIDHRAVLDILPPAGTAVLHVDVGDFVADGDLIVTVDPRVDDQGRDAVRDAVTLDRTRSTSNDLGFAIQQLVDVIEHATAPATHDTSTAVEALVHLRAVLGALLRRGTATGCLHGDDGQRVVSHAAKAPADHVRDVSERLRDGISNDPVIAATVLRTLELLARVADEVGDTDSGDLLEDERRLLTEATGDAGYTVARR